MSVAVIGANGQLGSDVCLALKRSNQQVLELNHDRIEISDFESCARILRDAKPDFVVNTAAMHKVDDCENAPENAFAVNGVGARNLAILANELNFALVHFSTDYVFDGNKKSPYIETDCPSPLNVYGNTKLAGEYFVQSIAQKFFVLRVSGLFGLHPCRAKGGRNFVTLMLHLARERDEIRVVDNEVLAPTYTKAIADQLVQLMRTEHYGLYHAASQGNCSWYEFAKNIFELSGTRIKLSIADPNEFPAKVPRPEYSALENRALARLGLDMMPHWKDGLKMYLEEIS